MDFEFHFFKTVRFLVLNEGIGIKNLKSTEEGGKNWRHKVKDNPPTTSCCKFGSNGEMFHCLH